MGCKLHAQEHTLTNPCGQEEEIPRDQGKREGEKEITSEEKGTGDLGKQATNENEYYS